MASIEKTVKVLFLAEDKITGTLKKIDAGFAGMGDFAAPFAKLGDSILKVEGAISILGAAIVGLSAVQFATFETASTSLSKILDDDLKPKVEGLEDSLIEFSNKTGVASATLLDTATDFKRAGAAFGDLNRLTKDSVKLFAAAAEAEFELGDATSTIIRVLKGFQQGFEDSGDVIDTVNILANEYATSVSELAEGLAKVSPVARNMGLTIKETAAFVTPVIEVFQSGSVAGRALSTIFQRLTSDISTVQGGFEALGVSQRDSNGELKTGKEILFETAEAFSKLSGAQASQIATQIAGVHQAPKFLALLGNWETAMEAVAVAERGTGSATKELNARLKDTQKQFDRVAESFKNVFVRLGKEIKVATGDSAGAVADLFAAIQTEIKSGTFKPLIDSISDVGVKFAEVFQSVAKNIPKAFDNLDFSGLISSFEDLQGSVSDILSAMFGDVDISTVKGLTDAIQNVIDAVTLVNNVSAGIIDVWTPIIGLFADITLAFGDMSDETQKSIGTFLGWSQVVVAGTAGVGTFAVALIGLTKAVVGTVAITAKLIPALAATGAAGLAGAFLLAGAAIGQFLIRSEKVDANMQSTIESVDKFFNLGIGESKTATQLKLLDEGFEQAKIQAKSAIEAQKEFNATIAAIPKDPIPDTYASGLKEFEENVRAAKTQILELALFGDEIPDDAFDFQITFRNQEELEAQKKILADLRKEAEHTKEVFSEDVEIDIKINAQSADEAELDLFKLAQERTAIISASVNEGSLKAAQDAVDKAASEGDHIALIEALADQDSLEASKAVIQTEVDGTKYFTSIGVRVDQPSKEKSLKELAKELPAEKQVKIAIELEQQRIDSALKTLDVLQETVQTKLQWEAKLDIAEVEAEAAKAIALSETLGKTFETAGSIIGAALGALSSPLDFRAFVEIQKQIDKQNEFQERSLELTERELEMQERLAAAKLERLKSGKALFTIDTTGMQPLLTALLFEITEAMQVEVTKKGGEELIDV